MYTYAGAELQAFDFYPVMQPQCDNQGRIRSRPVLLPARLLFPSSASDAPDAMTHTLHAAVLDRKEGDLLSKRAPRVSQGSSEVCVF